MRRFLQITISLFFIVCSPIISANSLTIGVPPLMPPLVMKADEKGQLTGFNIEIMNQICRRIEVSCVYKTLPFPALLAQVENGEIELGMADITIIPARKARFIFSVPYLPSYIRYITLRDSKIKTLNDLRGKVIGARNASMFASLLARQFDHQITVRSFRNNIDLLDALTSKHVDAVLISAPIADSIVANLTNLRTIGHPVQYGMGYGIIADKTQKTLIEKINKALLEIESDGTYDKLYNTYFSPENEYAPDL